MASSNLRENEFSEQEIFENKKTTIFSRSLIGHLEKIKFLFEISVNWESSSSLLLDFNKFEIIISSIFESMLGKVIFGYIKLFHVK